MLERRSLPFRLILLTAAVAMLAAGTPVVADHHADHPDEAVHLEHPHGGHGGILEQDDARIPAPLAPAVLPVGTVELPDARAVPNGVLAPETVDQPPGRAPPPDLPRGPPTIS